MAGFHVPTTSPAAEAASTTKSRKHSRLLLLGYRRPTEETFRQCGHLAKVRSENSVHRNVLEQCPQMTLTPTGWCCGSGLSLPMWTGPRLMMRLQYGLGQAILCDVTLQISRQLQGQRTYFFPTGAFFIGVASLQMLHFTTCWCVLPSTDMALWQTRQLMTGALLLSGLPCGE